jgi:hypothetical protein
MSDVFMDNTNFSAPEDNPNAYKKGLAVTAFILSLVNLVCCCTFVYALSPIGFIFVIPAIIFAIISLVTKRGGKGLAIAALIIAGISLIFMLCVAVVFREPAKDIMLFAKNSDKYIQMWDETHEVPAEFQKYNDPKYDQIWQNSNPPYKNFTEFYGEVVIKTFKQSMAAASQPAGLALAVG